MAACGSEDSTPETIADLPVTSLEGVLTRTGVSFDDQITSDGGGSIRVETPGPTTVRLFEIDLSDVDDSKLVYRAKLRTREVTGDVYLEMWCRIPGEGEFFSRGLNSPIQGTTEWSSQEIYFMLEEGQEPDLVKLNVVIGGSGTVWVDEMELLKAPLR